MMFSIITRIALISLPFLPTIYSLPLKVQLPRAGGYGCPSLTPCGYQFVSSGVAPASPGISGFECTYDSTADDSALVCYYNLSGYLVSSTAPTATQQAYCPSFVQGTCTAPVVTSNTTTSTGYALHPNWNSNKCLTVRDGVFQNGQAVEISDCTQAPSQKFIFSVGQTTIQVAGTNFCLDGTSAAPYDGTPMKIWECYSGLPAQTFWLTGDNRLALENSGKCLDLTNGDSTNGNQVQLWACTNGDDYQVWTT